MLSSNDGTWCKRGPVEKCHTLGYDPRAAGIDHASPRSQAEATYCSTVRLFQFVVFQDAGVQSSMGVADEHGKKDRENA